MPAIREDNRSANLPNPAATGVFAQNAPRAFAGDRRNGNISPADRLNHIQLLEAESIHIFREVVSEFQNPVMLYSIGKDSSVMLRLAQKAFYPAPIPFPLAPRRYRLQVPRDARIPRPLHG